MDSISRHWSTSRCHGKQFVQIVSANAKFPHRFSSSRRRLLFMDIRGGIALNYLNGDRNETDPYVSGGIGVTLAHKSTYSSHFIIGYTYLGQKQCYYGERLRDCPGISYATIRFGVTF